MKPDVLPCNLNDNKIYNKFVQTRTPLLLQGCADVCTTKSWDFAGDIIPGEQARKWLIADKKTGRFNGLYIQIK